jgi:F0F1-type ATP synthase assembly protein I
MWKQAGRLSAIGLEMGFAVSLGVLGGGYLDDRFGTKPLLFWIGFAVGLGAAVKAVVDGAREVRKAMEADDSASHKKS